MLPFSESASFKATPDLSTLLAPLSNASIRYLPLGAGEDVVPARSSRSGSKIGSPLLLVLFPINLISQLAGKPLTATG